MAPKSPLSDQIRASNRPWLQNRAGFGIACSPPLLRSAITLLGCGCSSGVEHNLAKVGVEGSNPFARSNNEIRHLDPDFDPQKMRGTKVKGSLRVAFTIHRKSSETILLLPDARPGVEYQSTIGTGMDARGARP